jgi:TatA/E family protein of Tat protein translocase
MFGIGPMELVVIVVVALLIFGPQRLPEFARNLGKGLAEFRRASNELRQTLALDELQNDLRKTMNAPAQPAAPRPPQAGDTLPPGSTAPTATPPSTTPPTQSPTSAGPSASAVDPNAPAADPPWKGHPGELPFGNEHEHHDPIADRSASDPSASDSPAPDSPAPETGPRLSAADSGLGNVPVTGADPSGPRRG